MKNQKSLFHAILLGIGCFIMSGCATFSAPKDQLLADVNGKAIAEKDLVASLNPEERQTYLTFKKQKVDRMIAQSLLEQEAERRHLSLQDLLTVEIFSKSAVSHDEVHKFYDQNKKAYKKKKHETWEKEISDLLQKQKQQYWTKKLLAEIAKKSEVNYYLPNPPAPKNPPNPEAKPQEKEDVKRAP